MAEYRIVCDTCGEVSPTPELQGNCPRCGGAFEFQYDLAQARLDAPLPGIWRFIDLLPVSNTSGLVTLHEGNTPLIRGKIGAGTGADIWWKWEGVNPTGAQKDRGLAVAIAHGREMGYRTAIIGSTGSAGLSSAAYAARAGMQQIVLVSRDSPIQRIIPMAMLGATILEVDGTIEDTLDLVARARTQLGMYETTTYRSANPYQSEGAKTLGYEIALQCRDLGREPDWVVIPVGGGGTLGSVWRAFQELQQMGVLARIPRMVGVQPADYNGLAIAQDTDLSTDDDLKAIPFDNVPPTILVKLAHTYSHDGLEALTAIRQSGGSVQIATDAEALIAQQRIGSREGLYAEPSSTVVLTAIEHLVSDGQISPGDMVVGVLTGSGHRETEIVAQKSGLAIEQITLKNGLDKIQQLGSQDVVTAGRQM